jgi:hypothetical protein
VTRRAGAFPALAAIVWIAGAPPAASLASAAPPPPPAQHQDSALGFRFDPPAGWKSVPVSVAGGWLVAKYQGDKEDYVEKIDTWEYLSPTVTVLAFPPEGGTAPADLKNPYANYTDYVASQITAAANYESKGKELANAGKKVQLYELTYTEPTSANTTKGTFKAPHRIIAWVHHFPDADIVAQFELLDAVTKKRQAEIDACLKSFRAAQKTNKPADPKNTAAAATLEELWKLTPEERKIRRTAAANAAYDRAKAGLDKEWSVGPEGRFFVVNHADAKFATKVTTLGNAILEFLDKNFDAIGKPEFVRKPILKLCADTHEFQGMRSEGSWWAGTNLEIITYKDEDEGIASPAFRAFSQSVYKHWLNERDVDFAMAAPDWLLDGFFQAFRAARIKDGSLAFAFDEFEYLNARISYRDKQHVSLRQMMAPLRGEEAATPTADQKANAARFFLAGMGMRDTKYRDMLRAYIKNIRSAISDAKREGVAATPGSGELDYKNRAEFWKTRKVGIQTKAAELTFASWKEADWKALEFAYLQYLTVVK